VKAGWVSRPEEEPQMNASRAYVYPLMRALPLLAQKSKVRPCLLSSVACQGEFGATAGNSRQA
jgi:hypothetical protein